MLLFSRDNYKYRFSLLYIYISRVTISELFSYSSRLLTGFVACAVYIATPGAGTSSPSLGLRTFCQARHLVYLLKTVFVVLLQLSFFLRANKRFYRECVRFEAHSTRGPSFLSHGYKPRRQIGRGREVHKKCICNST